MRLVHCFSFVWYFCKTVFLIISPSNTSHYHINTGRQTLNPPVIVSWAPKFTPSLLSDHLISFSGRAQFPENNKTNFQKIWSTKIRHVCTRLRSYLNWLMRARALIRVGKEHAPSEAKRQCARIHPVRPQTLSPQAWLVFVFHHAYKPAGAGWI